MPRFRLPAIALFFGLAAGVSAHAKSATWQDCFFREFDLCVGRSADADPEAKAGDKSACYGKAHQVCDDEERANEVKGGGRSANEKKKEVAIPSTLPTKAKPTSAEEVLAATDATVVEGKTPSGDNTVLGVDVTLAIFEVAERYRDRNVRGCHPIEDAYTRFLCVDAPGAQGGTPIELEYYRGKLVSLAYESASVQFHAAVDVAEEKTGTKPVMSWTPAHACRARFPLSGGTLSLRGAAAPVGTDPCAADGALEKVEWFPSQAAQSAIADQRKIDKGAPAEKGEAVKKAKEALPL